MKKSVVKILSIRRIVWGIVVGISLLQLPISAKANNLGIIVNKTAVVFDMDRGGTQEFVINIKNTSEEESEINIKKTDYRVDDDNSVIVSQEMESFGVRNWLNTMEEKVLLSPGEEREIKFVVEVPENTSIGSHKGLVLFGVTTSNRENVRIAGQVGVHILINIHGENSKLGQINYFKAPWISGGNVEYLTEFQNIGDSHYIAIGKVVIHNIITNFKKTYEYEEHFIFPKKRLVFSYEEKIPSILGVYLVRVSFVDGDNNMYTSTRFMVGSFFPFFIFILAILWYTIKRMIKKYKKIQR
jgi:hypothetical protein